MNTSPTDCGKQSQSAYMANIHIVKNTTFPLYLLLFCMSSPLGLLLRVEYYFLIIFHDDHPIISCLEYIVFVVVVVGVSNI
jgi:hypothetical protein